MSKQSFQAFLALALLTILAVNASAQSANLHVTVPFDFYVGTTMLPKGTYEVKQVTNSVLRIIGSDGQIVTVAPIHYEAKSPVLASALVFNRYDDLYFLSRTVWEGKSSGYEFIKTSLETEVARNLHDPRRLALAAR